MTSEVVCQSCGKTIEGGEPVVCIQYGRLTFTAHPHARVDGGAGRAGKEFKDWFHRRCDPAIRGWAE
jgi:hypothetical protein